MHFLFCIRNHVPIHGFRVLNFVSLLTAIGLLQASIAALPLRDEFEIIVVWRREILPIYAAISGRELRKLQDRCTHLWATERGLLHEIALQSRYLKQNVHPSISLILDISNAHP